MESGQASPRLQCDEIWCFVRAKIKNVPASCEQDGWAMSGRGRPSMRIPNYVFRTLLPVVTAGGQTDFMKDVASRIRGRVQLTADGHRSYLNAVEDAFGADVDDAMLQKIYGASDHPDTRYSPAQCIGWDMKTVSGAPDPKHVSTSFVEHQNLTIRMSMRRFTRLTNAFYKKVENHAAVVALHFIHYNFRPDSQDIRITPAMAAGICDHVWSYEEIASLSS